MHRDSALAHFLFWSVLGLPLRYPSVDLMPIKKESVATFERKGKLASAEQLVNRTLRHLEIVSQLVNRHEMMRVGSAA